MSPDVTLKYVPGCHETLTENDATGVGVFSELSILAVATTLKLSDPRPDNARAHSCKLANLYVFMESLLACTEKT